uniref:TIGR03084 family protein n=1 Tax=Streptoalloteichus sp. ATCC 53650 TaxID=756733 RepID=K4PC14_9PSEU|nr:hypothetical protein [Streptoalloteichus sp. ATCC 53650]
MDDLRNAVSDFAEAGDELDALVAGLDEAGWRTPTPAPGWTVAHQIAHLAATFRMATTAVTDPDGFRALLGRLSDNFAANVDAALAEYLAEPPHVLLARWREERAAAGKALAGAVPDQPVPWLVRPIPPVVLAAAGLMEMFGHGQDVADALGVRREPTDRLRRLVEFGVRTWDFGYQARGLTPPAVEFRFEVTGPSGALWAFGPEDSPERISGPANDFCLLVTRRRHHADLSLTATGDHAEHWLEIAQAYRGPAGAGRAPGQFGRGN